VQLIKYALETKMALEKKPLASKKALTTPASKSKRNVKGKVDTSKPAATKVATPFTRGPGF
jgi:hypothetical protein